MTDRYKNSKIYKLTDGEYFYIGSTCLQLHKRLYYHKKDAERRPQCKVYQIFTYDRFQNNEIKIILIESFQFDNKEELLREEDKHIQLHYNNEKLLNSIHAIFNLEKKKEWEKQYRIENRDELIKKYTQYYKQNRDSLLIKKKEYYNVNKDYFNEYDKIRNQNSDRKIKRNMQGEKKVTCVCGLEIRHDSMSKHRKSKKHLDFINNQQQ